MRTSLDRLNHRGDMTHETISNEVEFLSATLETLRDSGEISNDAYLDAGSIQGGVSVISNLIAQGVSEEEVLVQLQHLQDRAERIHSNHPELDGKIEAVRY